ncbi:MAG: hypothetical protein RL385_5844, partial [Pseudomonadota bacterium]
MPGIHDGFKLFGALANRHCERGRLRSTLWVKTISLRGRLQANEVTHGELVRKLD